MHREPDVYHETAEAGVQMDDCRTPRDLVPRRTRQARDDKCHKLTCLFALDNFIIGVSSGNDFSKIIFSVLPRFMTICVSKTLRRFRLAHMKALIYQKNKIIIKI
jgi:hypothetical protein